MKSFLFVKELSAGQSISTVVEAGGLVANAVATYVVSGRIKVDNPNRPPQEYLASPRRIAGGAVFGGKYVFTALEDGTLYKCFSMGVMLNMFEIKEVLLAKGESRTLEGVVGLAVILGEAEVDGVVVTENSSLQNSSENPLIVVAKEDCTIAYATRREVSDE